jgi:hypothetical protein
MHQLFPERRSFIEGLALLALGSVAGSVFITLLYLAHPRAAPTVANAATQVVTVKVEVAKSAGLGMEAGIFLANVLALGIIVLFPAFAYRVERDKRFAYSTVPKLMMVLIGFESIGLTSPPLLDLKRYLLFLFYLFPHGILEFSSIALAYTIAREGGFSQGVGARALVAFLLLIPAAYIEVHISLSFALQAMQVLFS